MIVWGQSPDPFSVWLLERGMKTLDVRVRRQNENAMKLAQWCETRPEFAQVLYPGLESHPDHEIAQQCLDGFGGMMALVLAGGGDAATRFLEKLEIVMHAPSLGGVDTLVSEPRYTSHAAMTPEQRAEIGIPDGFLRFSVGLEDAGDLIADFEQALR
jgi:cystathionine gamma-synthase